MRTILPVVLFINDCLLISHEGTDSLFIDDFNWPFEGSAKLGILSLHWDSHFSEIQVKRTYIGHSEGIRAIKMSNTGSHFLSTGFDRYIRYWDVETGQAGTYSNKKMAYDVKFYPRDNNLLSLAATTTKSINGT